MEISYLILVLLLAVTVFSGEDGTDNKIIGGELAQAGEFPYIVSLQFNWEHSSSHSCGGSLLLSSVVLTACHCIVIHPGNPGGRLLETRPASDYIVVAGVLNLAKRDFSSYRALGVKDVKAHPKCEKPITGWNWDFGLVQINGSFPMIPGKLQTINLPKFPEYPGMIENLSDLGINCVGAGWGVTSVRAKTTSLDLLKVDLKLLPLRICDLTVENYAEGVQSPLRFIPETQVCTIGENGKDACKGDSGGPLLCDASSFTSSTDNNNTEGPKLELIATVSWGIGCGRPGVPGGWARLDVAYDWIKETSDKLERTAPSGESCILKKDIIINLFFTALINAYSYSLS